MKGSADIRTIADEKQEEKMRYKLSPSILAADFSRLGQEIQAVSQGGAHYIHMDVMDGAFVPNISFGTPVIQSVRNLTETRFDVHLMVKEPHHYIQMFADCGADMITVHVEACDHLDRVIQMIRGAGKMAGVALNPATSLSTLDYILDKVDRVLIMTVNPGFGGQKFIESSIQKIERLRAMIQGQNLHTEIGVDGGINEKTIRRVLDAGADTVIAGSSVFRGNTEENVKKFLGILQEYEGKMS